MDKCLSDSKILANILAFLDGDSLADFELVCKSWNDCIDQSSLWKVRCMVDIERHELLDHINWHTIEKGELRFKGALSDCSGEYWKRIYAEWWNAAASMKKNYSHQELSFPLKGDNKCLTVITCACMAGSWILVGTNNGDVIVYSRKSGLKVKTVQKHDERVIDVAMLNEQHVNKFREEGMVEWGNTFVGMTEKCVLINSHNLQHQIVNDSGDIGRHVYIWKDFLIVYINFADMVAYKIVTKSIWDGEHETRQLDVEMAFKVTVNEGKMFLSQITLAGGNIFTCFTDESFHGNLKILSINNGTLVAHYVFTFSLNNFIVRANDFVLFSYRKVFFFRQTKSVAQVPKLLTKEAKFIAVTPFCSYTVCSKAKFGAVSHTNKSLHVHFDILKKSQNCSETLVPFKPNCVIETRSIFKYMLIDIDLSPEGPTVVMLDNEGNLSQYTWPYSFNKGSGSMAATILKNPLVTIENEPKNTTHNK